MRSYGGIGLLSATVLLLQVTLTRLFSVAQFYHFAFLVISLALLGFGISGSLLAVFPAGHRSGWRSFFATLVGPTAVVAYLIVNRWAFDSYAIAWDRGQIVRLVSNLVCLAIPFTFAGAVIGAFLADSTLSVTRTYGANMLGSAAGAAIAPILLSALGDERLIFLCAVLATGAAFLLVETSRRAFVAWSVQGIIVIVSAFWLIHPPNAFTVQPSPYKALSQFRRTPEARLESPRYNAYSRLDVVHSPTIHSAPGLSMAYFEAPPPEIGLLVDGDNLLPVLSLERTPPAFAQAVPAAVAFALTDAPDILILGAGGGFDVVIALQNGAQSVTAVEPNSAVYDVVRHDLHEWTGLASDSRVTLRQEALRTYARGASERFDIVQLALSDPYRPVTSGAFSLTENYTYTVEGFRDYLRLLRPDGMLIVTRWLQTPPSEELRTLGLILDALSDWTNSPEQHIVAFRTFQTVTFLVKPTPFNHEEVSTLLAEAEARLYDMVLAPDLPPEAINRFARLPQPVYHNAFSALIHAPDRDTFYDDYAFDVRPSTDEHPFFFHFFKWRQTPDVLNNLGRTWQPFGGSGYFVLVALLILASSFAILLILLPVASVRRFRVTVRTLRRSHRLGLVTYFGALGLAYLFLEVGMMQQLVLILGYPTLALAAVLGILLCASGLGSLAANRMPWGTTLPLLAAVAFFWTFVFDRLSVDVLGWPLVLRLLTIIMLVFPPGFLMGIPFARGLQTIRSTRDLAAWAWAINGSASVIGGVLAALVTLSWGFTAVFGAGALLYGVAWMARPILPRV